MTAYNFSDLTNGQHVAFDPSKDVLAFNAAGITARSVQLLFQTGGLALSVGSKTVNLDGVNAADLWDKSFTFLSGTKLLLGAAQFDGTRDWWGRTYNLTAGDDQVWGLGGADIVHAGAGNDLLVGNIAPTLLTHVSRKGDVGSPVASSQPAVSADGNKVVFQSNWTGFGTKGFDGIIVKTMSTGRTVDENRSADGAPGGSGAGSPAMSADGNFIAFFGKSTNLVPGDASGALYDVYLANTTTKEIVRVSTASDGSLAVDGRSENPDIAQGGRYVVFQSLTSNFAPNGSALQTDIFLKDVQTGKLTRLSTSVTGTDGNNESINPHISANGRYVVFQSEASNLVANDTNGYSDIFLWDSVSKKLLNITKDLPVDTNPFNTVTNADIAVRDNGDVIVVFETGRNLLAADDHNSTDVYALNVTTGAVQLVSAKADGTGVGVASGDASISDDGRWVVFTGGSDLLVPGDSNGYADVFVKDLLTGEIALVSRTQGGVAANQASGRASISAGGDFIVFETQADNLSSTDANGSFSDIYRVSNPLLFDDLYGGAGNDTYILTRADHVIEKLNEGRDTVRASFSYTLGANVEDLVLTGTGGFSGTGNALANTITGNGGANTLSGGGGNDVLYGKAGADKITGGDGSDKLYGGAGGDLLTGGTGNDRFTFDSLAGSDRISDFASGVDKIVVGVPQHAIGDGDLLIEGAVIRAAPGGFAANAELVIFSKNAAGLSLSDAAATIGSANSAIATGQERLFVVDNGSSSALFLFHSSDGNAAVSATELTLLATLTGAASTALGDYLLI
ncbi:hypothetical protein [Novosphingobium sp. PASSN1]|uniref:hypothetical protein n=1 Tax=Novosphingobium sp. PASSN1 TaxID=2015561 RepID=UPI000BC67BCD|nr:hypothetical protein [Novosphingobium sp. PASSN1]OYU35089.1 MAG: hypothetical protein CFE35_11685 [Novosphingobium sp. PASSN1]